MKLLVFLATYFFLHELRGFYIDEDKDEIDTPEMPVFQSDEGRLLSTKKIKPQKLSETGNGM